jgi:homocysteine S-methyltransferase
VEKPDLRTALRDGILIGDGAMGTYLYQKGFPVGISYEELNVTRPEVIMDVHRQYYEAGARLIETNTFSATREKLAKYGLEDEADTINRRAVEIARAAVGRDAWVVGAVGSIRAGRHKKTDSLDRIGRDFERQIAVLLDSGADGIILETFFDLEEMLVALRAVRRRGDAPVICQFAVESVGRTVDGFTMDEAFARLVAEGADVVGFNCRSGPYGILRTMEQLNGLGATPLSVFPNAGLPDFVDGRVTYMATPEYFAESAIRFADLGARIIGGCCGTTPAHIAAMARALQGYAVKPLAADAPALGAPATVQVREAPASPAEPQAGPEPPAGGKRETLLELVARRHTVVVELDPPRDLDIAKFMEGAEALHRAGADAITMADNSLAVTRMSNMALGALIKDRIGARPLVHIACRDRNLIGTQSHMMGLHALGIDHVLAVTGDPARFGDLPGSSSVYDLSSFEIIRLIKQLNEGIAFSGKPLKQRANFVVGAAFNPNVKNLDKAVQRMEKKIKAGADFIMTQPVYDPELIVRLHEVVRHIPVPIFIGIAPLASGRNAEYLHNEVPGIRLTDDVLKRMAGLKGEAGRAEGLKIARELLDEAVKYFKGIYLITPFLSYEMTEALTRYVWEITNTSPAHLSRARK